jgi:CubicO group peptidase (beta-lactamase class C family)
MRSTNVILALAGAVPLVTATSPCPLEGMVWPKPAKLGSLPAIQAAVANITSYFKQWDAITDPTTGTTNFSYSIVISSSHDDEPIFSYSHTAPKLAKVNSVGATEVGLDTVYRLGSLTKIFTIYTLLLNVGDRIWNDPITMYIPELAALANRTDDVNDTNWDEITIGALATQMAGIPRDCTKLSTPPDTLLCMSKRG